MIKYISDRIIAYNITLEYGLVYFKVFFCIENNFVKKLFCIKKNYFVSVENFKIL